MHCQLALTLSAVKRFLEHFEVPLRRLAQLSQRDYAVSLRARTDGGDLVCLASCVQPALTPATHTHTPSHTITHHHTR
jgi:hypothetical protein